MLSLSQTTGYAILALSCLSEDGETMTQAKEIAEITGISKPYLSKIIYRLGLAGLIIGKRGYQGGIKLTRPANQISIIDIADAIDGDDWFHKCVLGLPNCSDKCPCPMHEFWLQERPKIHEQLSNLTLDKVIQFRKQGWRL